MCKFPISITTLEDTVELMNSEDYRNRFKAEYYQTAIRYIKLYDMIKSYANGNLHFIPSCPIEMLKVQLDIMHSYLELLEYRAAIEGVDLM